MDDSEPEKIAETFIHEVREAFVAGKEPPTRKRREILQISESARLRTEFRRLYQEINDSNLQRYVIEYLDEAADAFDDAVDECESAVDLIDRGGMPIATACVAAGIAMLITIGATAGPLALLSGGLSGIGACGIGRVSMKQIANRDKAAAKKVRRLLSYMET